MALTATQDLHRITSMGPYDPDRELEPPVDDPRVVRDLVANDVDHLPWFYKRYAAPLPSVALPRDLPATEAPAVDVLAGTARVPRADLDLAQLSRLLHLSAGVTRTMERPYGTWLFRAAGSAGGRFPLELYVAVPAGGALPAGVFWYHPQDHALVRVGPPPLGESPALVVTGIPWRTGWKYRERGFRHVYWDAGTMLSQFLALADSAGIPAHPHTRLPDAAVAALVGADRVHEWPVAVVTLGDGKPALGAGGAAATGEVDVAPIEFPLVTAAQWAGERDALGPAWDRGAPVDVAGSPGGPVETVILSRGSQRLMDPDRAVPGSVLRTSLAVALRGISVPHWVAVHNVDGVEPGLYRWPELSSPVRSGDLRPELYRLCCDQSLGSEAAFVVFSTTDISTVDDNGYRAAQLAAGLVEGRLHLLAYALGASASGMTFADTLLPDLLGEPADGLLFTCIGTPEYRSAVGGLPGAARAIRRVEPRF
ncbi:hypothetical protein AB0J74_35085 [Asanoa sp. NPDC049573]|uniref:hypothetical protein n=1 Tax=Asanoa sp. NPDC049573 TaxID=3155396 RepID=UPI003449EF94